MMGDGAVVYDQYDEADAERVTERVVRCVASVTDTAPRDLPRIYDTVDPEALDALFPPCGDGDCHVSFAFAGAEVNVRSAGDIWVVPPDSE
jgi:hypothetical protein